MSDFVFLFRTNAQEQREHMGTPEMARQSMQAWLEWVRGLEAGGHVRDMGQPLDTGGKVVRAGGLVVDGPYAEAKDLVLGFMVITARDVEQAVELASGCPMLAGAGSVEVRPVASTSF